MNVEVEVEVEGGESGSSRELARTFLPALTHLCTALTEAVAENGGGGTLEIDLALRVGTDGSVIIALDPTSSHLRVKVKTGSPSAEGLIPVSPPPTR